MNNDTQQALLIKNAYRHPHETNTTALVTANGHVTIAHVDDLNTLFQFTLEQWQEIVDFVSIATWDELRDKPKEKEEDQFTSLNGVPLFRSGITRQ